MQATCSNAVLSNTRTVVEPLECEDGSGSTDGVECGKLMPSKVRIIPKTPGKRIIESKRLPSQRFIESKRLIERRNRTLKGVGGQETVLRHWSTLLHGMVWELILESGFSARLVFFLGGMWNFKRPFTQFVYELVFVLSFVSCGIGCIANCYYQEPPFHNLPSDFLTAYIHVPITHAWLFWRHFLRSDHLRAMELRLGSDNGNLNP